MSRPAVDHGLLSPSGKVSKRARRAAEAQLVHELWPEGLAQEPVPQPSARERLLAQAARLRDLAARGMHPRKYLKEAKRLEAEADLETPC